ncbi:MAG: putative phage transcriptional regulator [Candidatus Brocadia sinica]|nr:MAG: putative phage transcriptional regulator [Candidatus Brocadia sinica]
MAELKTVEIRNGLLTIDDLSEILKIKKDTLYQFTSRRKIPFIKIGNQVRFSLEQVETYLRENTVTPKFNWFGEDTK